MRAVAMLKAREYRYISLLCRLVVALGLGARHAGAMALARGPASASRKSTTRARGERRLLNESLARAGFRCSSTTPDGVVMRTEGAGLTNYPALDMPALASSHLATGPAGHAGGDPNAPLTAHEREVCASLGISEEAFKETRAADLAAAAAYG